MSQPMLHAEGLSKTYRVYSNPWDRLREPFLRRPLHAAVHALRDVSFTVPRGAGLGVVGENGAGKSTLLKILSGVTVPSSGSMSVGGRVASMLELGMGFHPELTGRQNIHLNAAMMGLDEDETAAKLPEIVEFSELGEFIDRPVKTYSSGMTMRLGFAIAVQVEPDILIIDEALSVGDGYFQKKCMDRIRRLLDRGCTFLFCSHAMYYVSAFCERALWLRGGRVESLGPAVEVIREYEHFLLDKGKAALDEAKSTAETTAGTDSDVERADGDSAGPIRLVEAEIDAESVTPGEPIAVDIAWTSDTPDRPIHLAVGIDRSDGVQVCAFGTHRDGLDPYLGTGGRARLEVPKLPMQKGDYDLYVYLLDEEGLHVYDRRVIPQAFRVDSPDYTIGLLAVDHHWRTEPTSIPASEESEERVTA